MNQQRSSNVYLCALSHTIYVEFFNVRDPVRIDYERWRLVWTYTGDRYTIRVYAGKGLHLTADDAQMMARHFAARVLSLQGGDTQVTNGHGF